MRYIDRNLSLHRRDDFITRDRMPTVVQIALLFAFDIGVVISAYLISDGLLQFFIIILILLGTMDAFIVWALQRSRDQMLVTEFQNALFSASLSLNNQLCIICRKDGVVVHTDVGFRSMLPHYEWHEHRSLNDVFKLAKINDAEAQRIFSLIDSTSSGHEIVTIYDENGHARRMMMYVDPIKRPSNYVLLRGRAYVENRQETSEEAR